MSNFWQAPEDAPLISAFTLERSTRRRQPWVFDHPRHLPSRICPHPGATRRLDILTISKYCRVFFSAEYLLIDEVWLILSPDTFVDVVVFFGVDYCFHPPILPCTLSLKNILTIILDRLWTLPPWTWSQGMATLGRCHHPHPLRLLPNRPDESTSHPTEDARAQGQICSAATHASRGR